MSLKQIKVIWDGAVYKVDMPNWNGGTVVNASECARLEHDRDALLVAAKGLLQDAIEDSLGPFIAIASPHHSERVIAMQQAIKDAEASQ